jgi:hypothetical protein
MNFEELFPFIFETGVESGLWIMVKVLVLFGLLIYLCFAGIVIRQVNLMTRTLSTEFETPLKFVAAGHFLLAIGVFLLSLMIL